MHTNLICIKYNLMTQVTALGERNCYKLKVYYSKKYDIVVGNTILSNVYKSLDVNIEK